MDKSSGEKMIRWKGEKLPAWKLSCEGNLRGEKELNVFQEKEGKKKKKGGPSSILPNTKH